MAGGFRPDHPIRSLHPNARFPPGTHAPRNGCVLSTKDTCIGSEICAELWSPRRYCLQCFNYNYN